MKIGVSGLIPYSDKFIFNEFDNGKFADILFVLCLDISYVDGISNVKYLPHCCSEYKNSLFNIIFLSAFISVSSYIIIINK